MRLSSQQLGKLTSELSQYKSQFGLTKEESETYKQRIHKLLKENEVLGGEVRNGQESLRLSNGQLSKLNNEFKLVCGELDEYKKRIQEVGVANKKIPELQNKIALLSQEVERLNAVVEKKNAEIRNLGGEIQ